MTRRVIAVATVSILTSIYQRYFNVSISGTLVYLSAVLSGIILVFGISEIWYFEVSISGTFEYLSAVFELPKSGIFEVSISGAFEYLLARYPLYRNICDVKEMDNGYRYSNNEMHIGDTYEYI